MPLGLWKSKWEIHREDMERHREEATARDDKWREEATARDDNWREEMKTRDGIYRREAEGRDAKRYEEAQEHRERMETLSEKYDRELAETRRFNAQMLTRLEKTYAHLGTTLGLVGEKLDLMGERIESNTEEVEAQTKAIMQLLDYFKGSNGGPPV